MPGPVEVLRPIRGTDWQVIALTEKQAREQANSRLVRFGAWYEGVRRDVAAGK